ncbi:MAG TPA: hypothetical protein VGQ88_08885 [Burkholderiales bacterium]|nr:hypothetical protein [Burkholderiales bacterium]
MRTLKIALPVAALLILTGCVAIPAGPDYYGAAPGYYAPAPAYYAPPVVYGPSLGISVYGGRRGGYGYRHRGWHH